MRLIEADKLKDTECNRCAFCLEDSNGKKDIDGCREMGCGVMDMIDGQPTVEAISVEQVANFLMKFLDDTHPCNFVWFEEKMMDDGWCANKCPIGEDVKVGNECWIHAINEGWLN